MNKKLEGFEISRRRQAIALLASEKMVEKRISILVPRRKISLGVFYGYLTLINPS